MDATIKDHALEFLKELEKTLNGKLLGPADMESWIRRTVAAAKTDNGQKHLRLPEAAFLNGQALPVLFDLLISYARLSGEQAQQALLSEYHRSTPNLARQSPIRWERHPFRKILGARASDIYQGWASPDKGGALTESVRISPSAIRSRILSCSRGNTSHAARWNLPNDRLVTDIYQAFFYRGLPRLAAAKGHPEWNYDYACLMAYDASPTGTLTSAWTALHPRTRRSFWEGANVYVMILRGSPATPAGPAF